MEVEWHRENATGQEQILRKRPSPPDAVILNGISERAWYHVGGELLDGLDGHAYTIPAWGGGVA